MTNTAQTTATTRPPMDPTRKTALAAGILYLITFVSIPTLAPPRALQLGNGQGLHHQLRHRHRPRSGAASSRSSSPSPASAPPSRCIRWSSDRTKAWRSASSPPAPLKPP